MRGHRLQSMRGRWFQEMSTGLREELPFLAKNVRLSCLKQEQLDDLGRSRIYNSGGEGFRLDSLWTNQTVQTDRLEMNATLQCPQHKKTLNVHQESVSFHEDTRH